MALASLPVELESRSALPLDVEWGSLLEASALRLESQLDAELESLPAELALEQVSPSEPESVLEDTLQTVRGHGHNICRRHR